jgi:hypothetical protein
VYIAAPVLNLTVGAGSSLLPFGNWSISSSKHYNLAPREKLNSVICPSRMHNIHIGGQYPASLFVSLTSTRTPQLPALSFKTCTSQRLPTVRVCAGSSFNVDVIYRMSGFRGKQFEVAVQSGVLQAAVSSDVLDARLPHRTIRIEHADIESV